MTFSKFMIATFLLLLTLTGCSAIQDYAKRKGGEVAQKVAAEKVSEQIPEEYREEFEKTFAQDKKSGLVFAGKKIGAEKLASIIESIDKENAANAKKNEALAAEIRAGGVKTIRERIGAIIMAFILAWISRASGKKKGASLPSAILRVVVRAIDEFKAESETEQSDPLLKKIKANAESAGVVPDLDNIVKNERKAA